MTVKDSHSISSSGTCKYRKLIQTLSVNEKFKNNKKF